MNTFFRSTFKSLFIALLLSLPVSTLLAGEGMWIPLLLSALNESEMKAMGMKMSADDIYNVNKGSLKDAIVHFSGFCTGEVISNQGLLLTNHHCGYGTIQSHSTLENNYLKDGFWAKSKAEEIPSPGLYAKFIVRIEDVTDKVFDGVRDKMTTTEIDSIQKVNIRSLQSEIETTAYQDTEIRSFFEGNQYFLFVTETYTDIRYVGSPPESIGKFGSDTDNWVWPRHTGDFALFRIYAGPDNKPAPYAEENIPYTPKHFLPVSLDGIEEGDFTLVFGFPGTTQQYLPSFAVQQIVDIIDPARIAVRDISLDIMKRYMVADEAIKLAYSSKYATISNYWKKWIGEIQGLKKANAVRMKEKQEEEFTALISKNKKLKAKYENLLPELKVLYRDLDIVAKNRTILGEVLGGRNTEVFRLASYADRLYRAYSQHGAEGQPYLETKDATKERLEGFFKDYSAEVDAELFSAMMVHLVNHLDSEYLPDGIPKARDEHTLHQWASALFEQSSLSDKDSFLQAIEKGGDAYAEWIQSDSLYQLYLSLRGVYNDKLAVYNRALYEKIDPLQTAYVTALMEAYPDRRFWPDANGTLRVSYGLVEPFSPKDGLMYKTQTYLDGVMEKYIPGDYEFDVHPKLIELYENGDFGPYGEDGKMPVCFIASNHSTGGNSGSPAIDASGNLIGLNFDRVWEGTMSDLYYDRSICRNIMVDARYILFVIDKFGGAGNLIEEMKLVHPKS